MDRSRRSHGASLAIRNHLILRIGIGMLLPVSIVSFGLATASPVLASECNADIGNFMKKRQGLIDELNKLAKAAPKGQLDPTNSCPVLRNLAVVERDLAAYLTKNKEWCLVPDNAVENITTSSKRTQMIAGKACQVAEQIKKGQEALTNSAPKLPAGPL
jgi:hypothetical protein